MAKSPWFGGETAAQLLTLTREAEKRGGSGRLAQVLQEQEDQHVHSAPGGVREA